MKRIACSDWRASAILDAAAATPNNNITEFIQLGFIINYIINYIIFSATEECAALRTVRDTIGIF